MCRWWWFFIRRWWCGWLLGHFIMLKSLQNHRRPSSRCSFGSEKQVSWSRILKIQCLKGAPSKTVTSDSPGKLIDARARQNDVIVEFMGFANLHACAHRSTQSYTILFGAPSKFWIFKILPYQTCFLDPNEHLENGHRWFWRLWSIMKWPTGCVGGHSFRNGLVGGAYYDIGGFGGGGS